MCGRFASARKRQELLEEFSVQRDRVEEDLRPDYNVAPTKPVYAVLSRRPRESAGAEPGPPGADGEAAERELRVVRWGLVPSWAKDISIGSRLINARAETVAVKPAFRRAFARHRCLLPADGYYEWEKTGDPAKPQKQPFYIHRGDGGVLAFAGLYELWRDKSVPDDDPRAWLWSATIITTRAEDEIGRIHDRMPMVIEPARWADWLDPAATSGEALHSLLAPAAVAHLTSYPVSTEVNSVRHNGPGLIEPLADAAQSGGAPRGAPDALF
ncbi:MAG TPA: SOS response-associated peptidase [Streptosporangiaceae bacterium]|nr:SOS response-associated peptidase [Streptosporangiaceae bacterium]